MNTKRLVIISVTLIIVVLTFTVLQPNINKVLSLSKENKSQKIKLAKLTEKAQQLEAIDENEIDKKVQFVEKIYPSEKPVMELLYAIEKLSIEQNVTFGGLTLEPGVINTSVKKETKATTGPKDFVISFLIEGSLTDISSFIRELEKTAPIMKIEKMDLGIIGTEIINDETNNEEASTLVLSAGLTVRVFYQPNPDSIGAVDTPLPIFSQAERDTLNSLDNFRISNLSSGSAAEVIVGKEDLFNFP